MKNNLPPWMIVLIIIGFVFVAVWSQFVDAPIRRAQGRMEKEVADAKALHDARTRVQRSIDELRALHGQFAPTADAEWLVNQLASRIQGAGLQIESIVPHAPVSVQDFQELTVTVQLSASYHEIGKLLSQLESSDPLIWIQDLDISKPREQASWDPDTAQAHPAALTRVRLTVATLYVPETIERRKDRAGALAGKPALATIP